MVKILSNGGLLCISSKCHFQSYWWLEIGQGGYIYAMEISKYYKSLLSPAPRLPPRAVVKNFQHPTAKSTCQSTLREHNLHPACSNHFHIKNQFKSKAWSNQFYLSWRLGPQTLGRARREAGATGNDKHQAGKTGLDLRFWHTSPSDPCTWPLQGGSQCFPHQVT